MLCVFLGSGWCSRISIGSGQKTRWDYEIDTKFKRNGECASTKRWSNSIKRSSYNRAATGNRMFKGLFKCK